MSAGAAMNARRPGANDGRSAQQRRANVRLAWTLATVALAFGVGFVAKIVLFGA